MSLLSETTTETTTASRLRFAETRVTAAARAAVMRVLDSGWLSTGPEVAAFEAEFAAYVEASHAVAVSSCTAAIELGLRALRLPPGSPVLTTTLTFCGAVHAIVHAGLRPVLVDVDPETLMPGCAEVAAAAHRAGGAAAMVVLHFAGRPAPVADVAAAADLPLARVVEDAAHGPGMLVEGGCVGALSAATCFSFYATKNLPIGEGGMLTTDDAEVAATVRRMRLHGMSADAWRRYLPGGGWRYSVDDVGLKANMTDVAAAIGRAHLAQLDGWLEQRARVAARYRRNLAGTPGLLLPAEPATGRHAWHLFVVRITPEFGASRDAVAEQMAVKGIDTSVHFIPVHHFPYFRRMLGDEGVAGLTQADAIAEQLLSLPLHPFLTDADVDRVCEALWQCRHEAAVGGTARGDRP